MAGGGTAGVAQVGLSQAQPDLTLTSSIGAMKIGPSSSTNLENVCSGLPLMTTSYSQPKNTLTV